MKVLLVEPDSLSASVIERSIRDQNICVAHASNAQEAVRIADRDRPDLVVLELLLADQNGVAFLHELHSHFDWMTIPTIVHTHVPRNELEIDPRGWLSLGVVDYLYKPTTSLARLKNRIQMVLS